MNLRNVKRKSKYLRRCEIYISKNKLKQFKNRTITMNNNIPDTHF